MVVVKLSTEDHLTATIHALQMLSLDMQVTSRNNPNLNITINHGTNGWLPTVYDDDMRQLYRRLDSLCVVNE